MKLRRAVLSRLQDVEVPNYLNGINIGSVHLGPGNFFSAHQAFFTHQLMQQGAQGATQWGIVGIDTLKPNKKDHLEAQDNLYTLVEQSKNPRQPIIIGALQKILSAADDPKAAIDFMARSDIRIISLTVTVNGYYLGPDKKLLLDHPDIRHDLTAPTPKTAIGYIAHAIAQRLADGAPPVTILSCDNIVENGDATRNAVLGFIEKWRPDILDRVASSVTFPNSMVDRIVPRSTPETTRQLQAQTGYRDVCAVPCEPMPRYPWIVEDKFANGRPRWEKVGAKFVKTVKPYELMKLRLLNASHFAIAGLGDLAGHKMIHETMADPVFKKFMRTMMAEETGPTLPPVPGIDFKAYQRELVARFANTYIHDTVQRVASDAPLSTVLDSARDRLAAGKPIDLLTLAVAAWVKRARGGTNEVGKAIDFNHPISAELQKKALQSGAKKLAILDVGVIFGDLAQNRIFAAKLAEYLDMLDTQPVRTTMQNAIKTYATAPAPKRPGPAKAPKAASTPAA